MRADELGAGAETREDPATGGGRIASRRADFLTPVRYLPALALLTALLVSWQVATDLWNIPDYLLPGPLAIWRSILDEHVLLLSNAVPTFEVAVLGYLLAVALGLMTAMAIHLNATVERTLLPIVVASQTVPVIALAPILVVLLGFTILPKLIIVCLICILPIIVNAVDGFKSVDVDLINLMRTLGATRVRLFRDVEFPTALPYIFSGAKVAITYSVIGALYGELTGSFEGLAYLMQQKESQFDTPALFAAMVFLTLMGIGLFLVVAGLERVLIPWHHDDRPASVARSRL